MLDELYFPWKDALIIKLLGKFVGYVTMKDRFHKPWKLQAGYKMIDVDNGYYMVKFDLEADREKVIEGWSWKLFDHYLVSVWNPLFVSFEEK